MKKIIALAAMAAISVTASAATNLVTDGSFESIPETPSQWSIVSQSALTADEGATGWTVTATAPTTAPIGLEVRDDVAGAAESGSNFIELDGNQNDKISQTLTTVVGETYDVSFYFSDRTGVAASSEGWALSVGSLIAAQPGGGFNTSGGNQWQEFTGSFVATSTSTTFSLWGTGISDSFGTSIDDISVVSAVPEPATMGLFAAGLAVLGLSARRRRQ
jgi:hypothetical protein